MADNASHESVVITGLNESTMRSGGKGGELPFGGVFFGYILTASDGSTWLARQWGESVRGPVDTKVTVSGPYAHPGAAKPEAGGIYVSTIFRDSTPVGDPERGGGDFDEWRRQRERRVLLVANHAIGCLYLGMMTDQSL